MLTDVTCYEKYFAPAALRTAKEKKITNLTNLVLKLQDFATVVECNWDQGPTSICAPPPEILYTAHTRVASWATESNTPFDADKPNWGTHIMRLVDKISINLPMLQELLRGIKEDSGVANSIYQSHWSSTKLFDLNQFIKMAECYNLTCRHINSRVLTEYKPLEDILLKGFQKLQNKIQEVKGCNNQFNPAKSKPLLQPLFSQRGSQEDLPTRNILRRPNYLTIPRPHEFIMSMFFLLISGQTKYYTDHSGNGGLLPALLEFVLSQTMYEALMNLNCLNAAATATGLDKIEDDPIEVDSDNEVHSKDSDNLSTGAELTPKERALDDSKLDSGILSNLDLALLTPNTAIGLITTRSTIASKSTSKNNTPTTRSTPIPASNRSQEASKPLAKKTEAPTRQIS
ncbi:hypothetical protein VP01_2053g1 [Puccinia sorghi]|uniref:Uncharacterized protein n=1 Tax=Puccinia sorghi TaxID=27349 RepID=A0A0L6VCM9_9BASI|nr:hypothetical protein VP01_2053g1 [Puccinia sorghi]